jgi:hypothetical protein
MLIQKMRVHCDMSRKTPSYVYCFPARCCVWYVGSRPVSIRDQLYFDILILSLDFVNCFVVYKNRNPCIVGAANCHK